MLCTRSEVLNPSDLGVTIQIKGSGFLVWGEILLLACIMCAHSNESSTDNTLKLMLDISVISTQQYSYTSRLMLMTAIYIRTLSFLV